MIFCEILRDAGASVVKAVSHEVGHLLGLEEAKHKGSFEPDKDGIMLWVPDLDYWGWPFCYKEWFDLYRAHSSPDRFSWENIADLRSNATD